MSEKKQISEGILKSFFSLLGAGVLGYILGKKSHVEIESSDPDEVRRIEDMLRKNKHKFRNVTKNSKQLEDLAKAISSGKVKNQADFDKYASFLDFNF